MPISRVLLRKMQEPQFATDQSCEFIAPHFNRATVRPSAKAILFYRNATAPTMQDWGNSTPEREYLQFLRIESLLTKARPMMRGTWTYDDTLSDKAPRRCNKSNCRASNAIMSIAYQKVHKRPMTIYLRVKMTQWIIRQQDLHSPNRKLLMLLVQHLRGRNIVEFLIHFSALFTEVILCNQYKMFVG